MSPSMAIVAQVKVLPESHEMAKPVLDRLRHARMNKTVLLPMGCLASADVTTTVAQLASGAVFYHKHKSRFRDFFIHIGHLTCT